MESTTFLVPSTSRVPRGFTLIELLVVLLIIITITSIALLSQSTFDQSIQLTDTAYSFAFSVREAQTLGLSSRNFAGVENAGYGIRFDIANPAVYMLYADISPAAPGVTTNCPGHASSSGPDAKPGNCLYDGSSELVEKTTFIRGYSITKMCGTASGVTTCSDANSLASVDISFLRPSTQAVMIGTYTNTTTTVFSSAKFYVTSPDGLTQRCVNVSQVGQVTVGLCS